MKTRVSTREIVKKKTFYIHLILNRSYLIAVMTSRASSLCAGYVAIAMVSVVRPLHRGLGCFTLKKFVSDLSACKGVGAI